MTRTLAWPASLIALLMLSGCIAWVDLKPQGEGVLLMDEPDPARCRQIGHVTSTTQSTIAFIPRDEASINEELLRLSRNYAGAMGGNAILPTGPAADGEQSFKVFHCKF